MEKIESIKAFLDVVKEQRKHYVTNNILITMGGDFTYQDARMWYRNLDKLIEYTNLKAAKENLKIKLFYSTPNCYLKAVYDAKPKLPTKSDDFFPYASDPHAYWTGYFTSRPTTKFYEREGNAYLQTVKQLQVLASLEEHNIFVIDELKSAMGVMQHHDAVTGTEKQHVAYDYMRMLDQAIEDALFVVQQALSKWMLVPKQSGLTFRRCLLNESWCDVSETSEQFVVTIYNPLAWHVNESIRIPIQDSTYDVYAPDGSIIDSQKIEIPASILAIPTRNSTATHEIVFIAYLKPVGYKSYYVIKKSNQIKRNIEPRSTKIDTYSNLADYWKRRREPLLPNSDAYEYIKQKYAKDRNKENNVHQENIKTDFENNNAQAFIKTDSEGKINGQDYLAYAKEDEHVQLDKIVSCVKKEYDAKIKQVNEDEGRMLSDGPMVVEAPRFLFVGHEDFKLRIDATTKKITHVYLPDGSFHKFTLDFYYYKGSFGDNKEFNRRASGAYIFRPNGTNPIDVRGNYTIGNDGEVVKEIRLNMNENAYATVRLYKGLNFIETEWVIGPIDVKDGIGKEYIVRYMTTIENESEFYTDSNGRQMLKRKLNKRPDYDVTVTEPVAGNYYPVTSKISLNDDTAKLTVLTDRSEGGSSLVDGQIELMLHRRLLYDDAFGVGEALDEIEGKKGLIVTGRHRILLSNRDEKSIIEEKKLELQFLLRPRVFLSDAEEVSLDTWKSLVKAKTLVNELPVGAHLLTLEPWGENTLLLRLENYFDKTDRKNTDVEVDLSNILKEINVLEYREATLAANFWKDEHKRMVYDTDEGMFRNVGGEVRNESGFKIVLQAKEIRTFVVKYGRK